MSSKHKTHDDCHHDVKVSHGMSCCDDPFHAKPDAPLDINELDPANRALSEALQLSFGLLKWVMVLLVVSYLFTGFFVVPEGQMALRLHFGSVVREGDQARVYTPDWYFGWPKPFDEMIYLPVATRDVAVDRAFWLEESLSDRAVSLDKRQPPRRLMPGKTGYLITADHQLVHARWTVRYAIDPARSYDFVRRIGSLEQAEALVRTSAERALVHLLSRTSVDDFIRGKLDRRWVVQLIRQELAQMRVGINVTEVLLKDQTAPLKVRSHFQQVTANDSRRTKLIEQARSTATTLLNDAAGPGYQPMLDAIQQYEQIRRQSPGQAEAELMTLFKRFDQNDVGGLAAEIIQEAYQYRNTIAKRMDGHLQRFNSYLPLYRQRPQLILTRLWEQTRRDILLGDVEMFYMPSDPTQTLVYDISRDARVERLREMRSNQQEQAATSE